MMKATLPLSLVTIAVLLTACGGEGSDDLLGGPRSSDEPSATGEDGGVTGDDDDAGTGSVDPAQCTSRSYKGFGNAELTASRVIQNANVDRGRMKPFSALRTEYPRVLGTTPATVDGAGPTFGQAAPRWYEEPRANSVALQTAYNVAFDGCLTFTASSADFAASPDATTAAARCATLARKFWSRSPNADEIATCVTTATTGTAKESDPRRKWAYACASVLTSAGFLSY